MDNWEVIGFGNQRRVSGLCGNGVGAILEQWG